MHKVLVIDDYPDQTEALSSILEYEGHEVAIALDGLSALDVAAKFRPSLALIDFGLPGLDGRDVGKILRERQKPGEELFLIGLTGWPLTRTQMWCGGVFDRILAKPFGVEQLLDVIRDLK
jgi:DNA-binding response OmpR family regulator